MNKTEMLLSIDVAQIAKVCHEANRAWCQTLGDLSTPTWESATQAQRDSMITGVLFRLNNPGASAGASHDAWMKSKVCAGWTLGIVKDEAIKQHPSLVPFDQLPLSVQTKDFLFAGIVKAVCAAVVMSGPSQSAAPVAYEAAAPVIAAGKSNDPSVQIGSSESSTPGYRDVLLSLGFNEANGDFVYNADNRAIWVSGGGNVQRIMPQITACAEAIGRRTKINEIKAALDIPFEVIETKALL